MKTYAEVTTIPAGSIVTCVRGHPLYRIVSDVTPDTIFDSTQFERIEPGMPVPKNGELVVKTCSICGEFWILGGHCLNVHFAEGWSDDIFGTNPCPPIILTK